MGKRVALWITALLGSLTGALLITTIVLAILYGIERNKTKNQQDSQGKV